MQSEEVVLLDSDDDEKAPGIDSFTLNIISSKSNSRLWQNTGNFKSRFTNCDLRLNGPCIGFVYRVQGFRVADPGLHGTAAFWEAGSLESAL